MLPETSRVISRFVSEFTACPVCVWVTAVGPSSLKLIAEPRLAVAVLVSPSLSVTVAVNVTKFAAAGLDS